MRVTIGVILVFLSIYGFGQTGNSRQTFVENRLGIPTMDNSHSEVEIRLTIDISLSRGDGFVLIRKENKKWYGQSLRFVTDEKDSIFKIEKSYDERLPNDFVNSFQSLVQDNFTDIADQEELIGKLMADYKHKHGDDAWFMIADGTTYYLTIKSYGKTKTFRLHSPWSYLRKFPNSKELEWYCNILDLIDKNVKIKVRN